MEPSIVFIIEGAHLMAEYVIPNVICNVMKLLRNTIVRTDKVNPVYPPPTSLGGCIKNIEYV